MEKLLRGVHVAVDQAGHGDGVPGLQGFACGGGFGGFSQPGDGVSGDGDGAVFDDGFGRVEADYVAAFDEEVDLWIHGVCSLVALVGLFEQAHVAEASLVEGVWAGRSRGRLRTWVRQRLLH